MKKVLLVLSLSVLAATIAHAQSAKIEIDDAWARPPIGHSHTTTAYMKLINRGTEPDRLVSASTPAAGKVELHTTVRDGDVLRMREVTAVDIKPGETVAFAPGAMHVMLVDAKPMQAGKTFTLTLQFEKAGKQDVTVEVRQGPMQGGHQHQH